MTDKSNDLKQTPAGLWQVFFRLVWPLDTWKKKVALGVIFIAAVCSAVWVYGFPDIIKAEVIHYFKQVITDRSETPLKSPAAGDSQGSQPQVSETPEMKRTTPFRATKERMKNTNTLIINQHTEGDQSPAIISNDVNITYDAPKGKKSTE